MNQQDEKTSHFLSTLKIEFDRAYKLKQDLSNLLKTAHETNSSYEYINDIGQSYEVQMLQLRDRILTSIKDYFYGTQQ